MSFVIYCDIFMFFIMEMFLCLIFYSHYNIETSGHLGVKM